MYPVRVKICGITRPEDALAAAAAGADALGFNFWPGSKRYIPAVRARAIIALLPPFVIPVGVFVNQKRDEIEEVAASTGIHVLQLHGDETPEACGGYLLPVVKAIRVGADFSPEMLNRYAYAVSACLLDTPSSGFGGTGSTFDWGRLASLRPSTPIILAGGLTPNNVAAAVDAVKPYAVDVASGVEQGPGVKDAVAMQRFVGAAKGSPPV
jgi:phosphoribosylanthranilate isomerase